MTAKRAFVERGERAIDRTAEDDVGTTTRPVVRVVRLGPAIAADAEIHRLRGRRILRVRSRVVFALCALEPRRVLGVRFERSAVFPVLPLQDEDRERGAETD